MAAQAYHEPAPWRVINRAAGGRFCPGTRSLFAIGRNSEGQAITLTRIDVRSGKTSAFVIRPDARVGPMVWRVAPQPHWG